MTSVWLNAPPVIVPDALRAVVGGHPVVAERLARQGFTTPDSVQRFLTPAAYTPASPFELPDMSHAVECVQHAITHNQTILVWGDFDVDGQTSTALLVSALRELSANLRYHIPNRFSEGHGVHLPTLQSLIDGIGLLLTCDTGVSAHEAVTFARSRGVAVVITDHHTLPDHLPDANAVINPMRLPEGHPLRELPGVGTAYQLVRALYGTRPTDHLLDLVAVGIIADVMVLVDDTRYWLQRGLEVLRHAQRPGLRAILERAEIEPAELTESDIGFTIGPRLNALGRLADANPAVELLTTSDIATITERVAELEALNQKRRFLTRQVYQAVQDKIAAEPELLKYAALVVAGEGWHTGVVGIVASRLAEEYACPVIILSDNEGTLSGSARSVAGCNIAAVLHTQAHLLTRYGGHNMAAGLSLPADKLFEFRRGLSHEVRRTLGAEAVQPQHIIDGYLSLAEITLDFAEDIARLAPFGNGNAPLTLATKTVRVKSRRTLGSRGDHLALHIEDTHGHEQRVIWWFGDASAVPEGAFDLAYTVRPNVFNGKREALIEWVDARPSEVNPFSKPAVIPDYTLVDERQHPNPYERLQQVLSQYEDVLVWHEDVREVIGSDRFALHPAKTLVVWSPPPGPVIWETCLQHVQPETLILLGGKPPLDEEKALLANVGAMLNYARGHKNGIVIVSEIAAATSHHEPTIRACLRWYAAQEILRVTAETEDRFHIERNPQHPSPVVERVRQANDHLRTLLAETRAYRKFWLSKKF